MEWLFSDRYPHTKFALHDDLGEAHEMQVVLYYRHEGKAVRAKVLVPKDGRDAVEEALSQFSEEVSRQISRTDLKWCKWCADIITTKNRTDFCSYRHKAFAYGLPI